MKSLLYLDAIDIADPSDDHRSHIHGYRSK